MAALSADYGVQIVRSAFLFVSAGDGREADDCAGTVCFDDDCRNFNRSRLRFCSVGMAETCIELRGIRRADPVVRYPYAGGVFRQGAVGESGREKLLFRLIIFLLKIFRRKKAESVWRRGCAAFYEEHFIMRRACGGKNFYENNERCNKILCDFVTV